MIFAKDLGNRHTPPELTESSASSSNSNQIVDPKNRLKNSFAKEEFTATSSRINNEPLAIFLEEDDGNTNTYSFDVSIDTHEDDVSVMSPSPPERITASNFKQEVGFLWKVSFYKSLFFLVTVKYSTMVFWILFPTYLYIEMDRLQLQQTSFLVGSMGLGSLFIGLFTSVSPALGKNKHIVTSAFCLIGCVGYFSKYTYRTIGPAYTYFSPVLSDAGSEGWLLFGALLITSSITALHVLHPTMIKYTLRDDSQKAHVLLHTLTGILILLFLVQGL